MALYTTLEMIERVPRHTFSEEFMGTFCEMRWHEFLDLIGPDTPKDKKLYLADLLRLGVTPKYVLWGILCLPKEQYWRSKAAWVHFACDCAERVLPLYEADYPGDFRVRKAIEASRNFAEGKTAQAILKATRDGAEKASDEATPGRASFWAAWAAAELAAMARKAVRRDRGILARTARGAISVATMARGARHEAVQRLFGFLFNRRQLVAAQREYLWQSSRLIAYCDGSISI